MIKSPCSNKCCVDDPSKNLDAICLGCGRTVEEIISWSYSNDETKQKILKRIKDEMPELLKANSVNESQTPSCQ